MSSRKTATRRATTKKRAQRATSNVFAMFDQAQIAEFKVSDNERDTSVSLTVEQINNLVENSADFVRSAFTFVP